MDGFLDSSNKKELKLDPFVYMKLTYEPFHDQHRDKLLNLGMESSCFMIKRIMFL